MRFRCRDADATRRAARALANALDGRGLIVGLIGPLGVGKTVFVKGLAEGLGFDPAVVSSPTFVIVNQYFAAGGGEQGEAPRMLAHVDLYRVRSPQELDDAGFVDLLEPGAVVAVEWADRAPAALPEERLELTLARVPGDPDSRSAAANATGREAQAVLTAWERRLAETDGIELSASARRRSQQGSQPKRPA